MSPTATTNSKDEFVTRVVKLNIDTTTMRAHQHQLFRQYAGATRAVYNWAVSEWRNYKKLEYDYVNQLIINHIGTDNPEKMSEFRKDANNKKLIKDFYKQYEPKEPNGFSLATKLTEGMKDPDFPFYWNRSMPRNGQKRKTRAIPGAVTNAALATWLKNHHPTIYTEWEHSSTTKPIPA